MRDLSEFYKEINQAPPSALKTNIGHFNIFDVRELYLKAKGKPPMTYNRRTYHKISLIHGKNRIEYADEIINVEDYALLFSTPRVPYHYLPQDLNQEGFFCVFSDSFLPKSSDGSGFEELPIFHSDFHPVFLLDKSQYEQLYTHFQKMSAELGSDYAFKYDLIRNYVMELVHFGQKLQPVPSQYTLQNASKRITALFLELLERQFTLESPGQRIQLRSPSDFADRLSLHVNYLNKALKEATELTTSSIINGRIAREAQYLLKETPWNISEISNSLGFEETAHFSNFFKKHTGLSPLQYRSKALI
ncbi:helix-turn-helix transcriptional regulator [Algoriphagus aestuariicola]|uniref:Helix-turn-helix transcriptional regulator n=1 Tax=Algoriphagus aestuariicola TaxID=1852016 RepID=A0ABS3BSD4_9BACT|nr:AraC family transcriptional regulator [Algoriphagus aestuariicola]MBN7802194.1 helix-turn-helix transcriptional regulator [Algoriphagus aestuariicola]